MYKNFSQCTKQQRRWATATEEHGVTFTPVSQEQEMEAIISMGLP